MDKLINGIKKPDLGLLLIRIAAGVIFIVHGIQKLTNIEGTTNFFTAINIPMPSLMAWLVGLIETLGGAAILFGVGTGVAAILLGIIMLVAIFTVKIKNGLQAAEYEIILLASMLLIFFSGPGKIAMSKKASPEQTQMQ